MPSYPTQFSVLITRFPVSVALLDFPLLAFGLTCRRLGFSFFLSFSTIVLFPLALLSFFSVFAFLYPSTPLFHSILFPKSRPTFDFEYHLGLAAALILDFVPRL